MADIVAGDVTYTIASSFAGAPGKGRCHNVTIGFGDAVDTYPAGGIPLTKAKMGCPTEIVDFYIEDDANASGIVWKYDKTNNKLRGYLCGGGGTAPAVPADPIVSTGAATASAVDAVTPTIVPGVMKELVATTAVIAAQSVKAVVIGY